MKVSKPVRVARSYVQRLFAGPARVFPLLCPVRETEWVEGWDPELVLSESGVAERDCVFVTREPEAVWVVTEYEPPRRIGFVKVVPGVVVTRISIGLEGTADGDTEATVSYGHTALGPEGERLVERWTEEEYTRFMETWETALNRYLAA